MGREHSKRVITTGFEPEISAFIAPINGGFEPVRTGVYSTLAFQAPTKLNDQLLYFHCFTGPWLLGREITTIQRRQRWPRNHEFLACSK